jgi:drug/metabolite transporter (DMT)-like permease
MAVFDWLRPGGQAPRVAVIVGIAVGLSGIALLVAPGQGMSGSTPVAGTLALIGADVAWAGGVIYTRQRLRDSAALPLAATQLFAGGAALAVCSGASGEWTPMAASAMTAKTVLTVVYLAIFGSVIAYSAYAYILRVSTPVAASTTAFVNPAIAVVLGWVVLGEALSARQMAGAGVILVAVVFLTASLPALRRAAKRIRLEGAVLWLSRRTDATPEG